jgi:tetratricopeptide (TPR) repeat protein
MKFSICVFEPSDYKYSHFLYDLCKYFCYTIEANGYDCCMVKNRLYNDRINILMGTHTLTDPAIVEQVMGVGKYVVIQTEVLREGGIAGWPDQESFSTVYVPLLQHAAAVWDGVDENQKHLQKLGITPDAFPRFGYLAPLEEIIPKKNKDIDFLYYGSLTEHRRKLFDELRALGGNVVTLFDEAAVFRNDYIARTRVHLAPNQTPETNRYISTRVLYLLNNRSVVVVEHCYNQEWLEHCYPTAETGDWASLCMETLHDPDLDQRAEGYFEHYKKLDMTHLFKPLLDKLSTDQYPAISQINAPDFEPAIPAALQPGYAALDANDYEGAVVEFRKAIEAHPEMAATHITLGRTLLALERPKEALRPLRRAIKLAPAEATAHNLLGTALYRLERHHKAKAAFKQAISVDPNNIEARLNLIDFHKSRNEVKQALSIARETLALAPQNVEVLTTCGLLMLDTDDMTGAELAWQGLSPTASADHPGVKALLTGLIQRQSTVITPDMLLDAVEVAQQSEDWPQAVILLKTLLGRVEGNDTQLANLWNQLGTAHYQQGSVVEALIAFEKGTELDPQNLDILSNRAALYHQQGDYDQATEYINQALAIDPDDVNTLLLLGNCAIELGNLETARLAFTRVYALAPETEGVGAVVEQLNTMIEQV